MADFSLFCLGSLLSLQTAAWTALAEGTAPAPPPPFFSIKSLPCWDFEVPTNIGNCLRVSLVCSFLQEPSLSFPALLAGCRRVLSGWEVRNKRTTQQQLRTVQRVWALPIRLRLSGCVSLGKLFHYSGLWAPHLKSGPRGPTG